MLRRDITRCVQIERVLFPGDDPWSAQAFHAELDAGGYYLVARPDEDGSDELRVDEAAVAEGRVPAHPRAAEVAAAISRPN